MALRLTEWGSFVNQHSVMTPPAFWQKLLKEVRKIQDEGGEWELMLDERIADLKEMKERIYEF